MYRPSPPWVRVRVRVRVRARVRVRSRVRVRVRVKHVTSGVSREVRAVRDVDSAKSGGAREERRFKERLLGEARLV